MNWHLRFARGAELLQTQGVDIPCFCPGWQSEPNTLLQHVAGNMYCLPVVAWYTLWGLATCLPGAVLTSEGLAAAAGHQAASVAAWEASAESQGPKLAPLVWAPRLLRALLQASPMALLTATGTGPTTVRVGSLCSGPDFVKDFLTEVLGSISHLPGGPALVMENVFACELSERVWGLRARNRLPQPVHMFKDSLMLRADQSIPHHSCHPVAGGAVRPVWWSIACALPLPHPPITPSRPCRTCSTCSQAACRTATFCWHRPCAPACPGATTTRGH